MSISDELLFSSFLVTKQNSLYVLHILNRHAHTQPFQVSIHFFTYSFFSSFWNFLISYQITCQFFSIQKYV